MNQKEIAKVLDVNEMSVSRLVRTPEAHAYLARERRQHGSSLVSTT